MTPSRSAAGLLLGLAALAAALLRWPALLEAWLPAFLLCAGLSVGALGALVHGPVVFRGFRFYPTSGYHLEAVWESDEDEDEDEEDGEPDIYNANESSKSVAPHLAAVLGVYDCDKNEDLGEGDEGQD